MRKLLGLGGTDGRPPGGGGAARWRSLAPLAGALLAASTLLPSASAPGVWSGPILLETRPESAASPVVGVDDAGNAIAIWDQWEGPDRTTGGIYANRFVRGVGWGGAVEIGGGSPLLSVGDIAVAPNGWAMAVWIQPDGGYMSVHASRFLPGFGWDAPALVESAPGAASAVQVAADSAGFAIAVWLQSDGAYRSVNASHYAFSTGWGGAASIDAGPLDAQEPHVAMDAAGNAIAVWQQSDGTYQSIYASRYAVGTGWGAAAAIDSGMYDAERPRIDMNAGGTAFAAWQQVNPNWRDIRVRSYVPGTGWGTIATVDAEWKDAWIQEIAVDAVGDAIVTWEQITTDYLDLVFANRYVPGTGWGAPVGLSGGSSSTYGAEMDSAPNGNTTVAMRLLGGSTLDLYAIEFAPGTGWAGLTRIESGSGDVYNVGVAMDPAGNAFVVWDQTIPPSLFDANVWANRYVASDVGPPFLYLLAPMEGETLTATPVRMSGTASDPDTSIARVEVRANGGAWATATGTTSWWALRDLVEGANLLEARAVDRAGNWSPTASVNVTYAPPRPLAPTLTSADLAGASWADLDLAWDASPDEGAPAGTREYRVLRADNASGPFSEVATVAATGAASYAYTCAGCGHNATDANMSFFRIQAVNAANRTADSGLAAKFAKAVTVGGNLLAVPVAVADESVTAVLRTLAPDVAAVRRYVASDARDPWKAWVAARGGGDLAGLPMGSAFWVEMSATGVYTVAGLVDTVLAAPMSAGWNLVGYRALAVETRAASLAEVPGVTWVETFDPSPDPYRLRAVPPDEVLAWGEGYWVYTTAGGLWVQG